MCCSNVDFPLPVCPAIPKKSPSFTVKLMFCSAHWLSGLLPQSAYAVGEGVVPATCVALAASSALATPADAAKLAASVAASFGLMAASVRALLTALRCFAAFFACFFSVRASEAS